MRSYNSNTLEALNDGTDLVVRWLLLVTAKTFDTVPESATLALWNELYNQSFTVGGSSYQFYGAGSLISIDPISADVGIQVRYHEITLNILSPDVESLLRGYDARLAPVSVYRILFNPQTRNPYGNPHRMLKGWVDEAPIVISEEGGESKALLRVAGAARALTRFAGLTKSDAHQKGRDDDRGRRWGSVAGTTRVVWGEKAERADRSLG